MPEIRTFKLFSNKNEKSRKVDKLVKKTLLANGFLESENFDLGIAIGGDGSFLRMVKSTNFNSNVLYVGINTGTLGFAQEVTLENLNEFVEDLKCENYRVDDIGVQKTKVVTKNGDSIFYSLNEIVLRDKNLNTVTFNVEIENTFLEKFQGDGLLIATSFGSTAYNLSFGGSIIYNNFNTLQITPIAPLNNSIYRNLRNSLVLPENLTVKITPINYSLLITIDGENSCYDNVLYIVTSVKDKKIKCLRTKDYDFILKVNEKFLK